MFPGWGNIPAWLRRPGCLPGVALGRPRATGSTLAIATLRPSGHGSQNKPLLRQRNEEPWERHAKGKVPGRKTPEPPCRGV